MLFNTQENPYKLYVSLDNLEGVDRESRVEKTSKRTLGDAPVTVTEGDTGVRFVIEMNMHSNASM